MTDLNRVFITGNLTRDPELKYTPKGTAITSIGVAVNRSWKNDAGELQEEVSFIDCTAFGKTAEALGKYFNKGAKILIEGRLKMDSWDDKTTGQKRSKLGVVIESWLFQGAKKEGEAAAPARRAAAPAAAPAAEDEDSDVPF